MSIAEIVRGAVGVCVLWGLGLVMYRWPEAVAVAGLAVAILLASVMVFMLASGAFV